MNSYGQYLERKERIGGSEVVIQGTGIETTFVYNLYLYFDRDIEMVYHELPHLTHEEIEAAIKFHIRQEPEMTNARSRRGG